MQIQELIEKYQIKDLAADSEPSEDLPSDPCEAAFLRAWKNERKFLGSISQQIRNILKTEGAKEADHQFRPFFFLNFSPEQRSMTSMEEETKEEALFACLLALEKKLSVLVQEYFFSEKKKGLFSKKSFQCTVKYSTVRWNDFHSVVKEMAEGFLRCKEPDEKKALEYLRLCDPSDPEVLYLISENAVAESSERKTCKEEARREFERRAKAGDVRAAGFYAKILLPVSPEEAARYAEIASSAGQPEGLFLTGRILERGLAGRTPSKEAALKCYIRAAEAGCMEAGADAGRLLRTGTEERAADPDGAFPYYKLGADCGIAEAQYRTGLGYLEGTAVPKDASLAMEYFRLAADQGHILAQLETGTGYLKGRGVVRSPEKAFSYLKQAADKNNPEAAYQVGKMLSENLGTKKDPEKALGYYRQAADAGVAEAAYQASVFLGEGRGCEKDPEEAKKYLRLAAEKGSEKALKRLANTKDEETSKEYLEKLAKEGNAVALTKSGMAYASGTGVQRDPEKAFQLFLQAADLGYKEARYRTGLCYRKGIGTPADASAALHYFRLAADQGHLRAYSEAEEMEELIRELEASGRLCREIGLLSREGSFSKIFSLIREYGDILYGKEEVVQALSDFIEAQTKEGLQRLPEKDGAAYIRSLREAPRLAEGLKTGEDFYRAALQFDREKKYLEAVTGYYYSALQGSLKGLSALNHMAVRSSRYFIEMDETYLREEESDETPG